LEKTLPDWWEYLQYAGKELCQHDGFHLITFDELIRKIHGRLGLPTDHVKSELMPGFVGLLRQITSQGPISGVPSVSQHPPNTIVFKGSRQYQIGEHPPNMVTCPEDAVLQPFLKPPAIDDPALRGLANAVSEPGKILRGLRRKYNGMFAPAIDLPGGKGKGGYHVRIISELAPTGSH
jgi:hypothetical protein